MTDDTILTHTSLTHKCLELCHALTNQRQAFKFSIMLGTSFSFVLDTRSQEDTQQCMKKKPSPSSLKRNQRRRQEFCERRKTEDPEVKVTHKKAKYKCELCDFEINSQRELETHMERKHKGNDQLGGSTLPLIRSADGINEEYQVCKACGKEFGSNVFLELHKEMEHDKTENFVFSESMLDEWDPEVAGGNH